MITLEQARKIAQRNSPGSTTMVEHPDAYEFYKKGIDNSEIVILKSNGKFMDYQTYVTNFIIPKRR